MISQISSLNGRILDLSHFGTFPVRLLLLTTSSRVWYSSNYCPFNYSIQYTDQSVSNIRLWLRYKYQLVITFTQNVVESWNSVIYRLISITFWTILVHLHIFLLPIQTRKVFSFHRRCLARAMCVLGYIVRGNRHRASTYLNLLRNLPP